MFVLFCSVSIGMTASILWLCKGRLTTQSPNVPWAFSESKSEVSSLLELPEASLSFSLSLLTQPLSSLEISLRSGLGRTGAEDTEGSVCSKSYRVRWCVGPSHTSSTFSLPSLCLPTRSGASFSHDLISSARSVYWIDTSHHAHLFLVASYVIVICCHRNAPKNASLIGQHTLIRSSLSFWIWTKSIM